jgi:hypothetical protein
VKILGGGVDHGDYFAAAFGAKLHFACCEGKQGVVVATSHIVTGVKVGSALTHDDFAGLDDLTAEALHSQVLGLESRPLRVEDAPFLCAMS